jgi:hypothetical protein
MDLNIKVGNSKVQKLRGTFPSTNFRRSRKISKGDYWLCHVWPSVSVEQLAHSPSEILMKFDI